VLSYSTWKVEITLENGGMNLGDENWPIRYYKEVLSAS